VRSAPSGKIAAFLALICTYAALSHYCNTGGHGSLGAALALTPFALVGASLALRSRRRLSSAALALLVAAALYVAWPLLENNFSLIYLLQECGLYGLLAVGFARSLRSGETPLCTQLADRLHGPLTAAEVRYTRKVTIAWTLLLTAITLTTLALYLAAPLSVWSGFDNFVVFPLIATAFIAEYAIRRRVLPEADRGGILATVSIFLASR
jgi:uncharacterized membrane protein